MSYSIIDKAKFQIVVKEPFFATLLMGMPIVLGDKTPDGQDLWLAATDGSNLYMNPDEVNKLPLDQVIGLIIHELYHVALLHPFRRNGRDPEDWNVANDYIINDMVVDSGYAIPEGGIYDQAMKARQYSSEELYNQIHQEKPPNDGGDGQGSGDPMAGDILEPQGSSGEVEEQKKNAEERVVEAAQVGKAMGSLPGAIATMLNDVLNPKKDWREQLQQFCTETAEDDFTLARPNRRFVSQDWYLPSMHSDGAMKSLSVVIDTSGSITSEEIVRFCSELIGAINSVDPKALNLVYCDAAVAHAVTLTEPTEDAVRENLGRYGGGGTNMTVGLDYVEENYPDTSAAIVFTDGGTPFGSARQLPVLWAMTSTNAVAPHGQTIHVEV